jgi:hypothetical protein
LGQRICSPEYAKSAQLLLWMAICSWYVCRTLIHGSPADRTVPSGWQAFIASSSFATGQLIFICASLNNPEFQATAWYVTRSLVVSACNLLTIDKARYLDDYRRCSFLRPFQHRFGQAIANVRRNCPTLPHLGILCSTYQGSCYRSTM